MSDPGWKSAGHGSAGYPSSVGVVSYTNDNNNNNEFKALDGQREQKEQRSMLSKPRSMLSKRQPRDAASNAEESKGSTMDEWLQLVSSSKHAVFTDVMCKDGSSLYTDLHHFDQQEAAELNLQVEFHGLLRECHTKPGFSSLEDLYQPGLCFIVRRNFEGRLIAGAAYYIDEDYLGTGEKIMWLQELVTHPEVQDNGLGTEILELVEQARHAPRRPPRTRSARELL